MSLRLCATLTIAASLAGSGCSDDGGGGGLDAIKIGLMIPLSGGLAGFGPSKQNAALLAAEQINSAGGIQGRLVDVLIEDDRTDPDYAFTVAQRLIHEEDVVGIVGPSSSGVAVKVQEETFTNQVPEVSCCASSPDLTNVQPADDRYFFRIIPPDDLQAAAMAWQARNLTCDRLALLYIDNAFGQPFGERVEQSWGRALVARVAFPEIAPSFVTQLQEVSAATPDCIGLVGFPGQGGPILREWAALTGAPEVRWIMVEAMRNPDLVTEAGNPAVVDGVTGVAPVFAPPTPQYNAFAANYEAAYGMAEPGFAGLAYDAMAVLLLAVASVNDPSDGVAVRNALYDVSRFATGDRPVGPDNLTEGVQLLSEGRAIDYHGATNRVDFDAFGNTSSNYIVWSYEADTNEFMDIGEISETELGAN